MKNKVRYSQRHSKSSKKNFHLKKTYSISKNILKKNFSEIKNISWITEIIKTIVISVLTIVALFVFRTNSLGNKSGELLKQYLDEQITKDITCDIIDTKIIYSGPFHQLNDSPIIVTYSNYNSQNYKSGKCLYIFERKKTNVINDLLGTTPAYVATFACHNDDAYGSLEYLDFHIEDLDDDGKKELFFVFTSKYATRASGEMLFLSNVDKQWKVVNPDMDKFKNSVQSILGKSISSNGDYLFDEDKHKKYDIYLDLEIQTFNDVFDDDTIYYLYGVSKQGDIYSLSNPFNSAFEICYQISYQKENSRDKGYMYSMQQFNQNGFFIDPNWNMGEPLISDEVIDIKNDMDYWGITIGDQHFYADPGEPLSESQ